MTAAKACRNNGWKPGQHFYGAASTWDTPGIIRLTGIGESSVLARRPGCAEFELSSLDGFAAIDKGGDLGPAAVTGNAFSRPLKTGVGEAPVTTIATTDNAGWATSESRRPSAAERGAAGSSPADGLPPSLPSPSARPSDRRASGRGAASVSPYYQDEQATIYCGDCREILPTLPDVDLVLTDPPYGLGERMQGGTWGAASKYADLRRWDVAPTAELLRLIVAKGRVSVVWGGNHFHLPPSRCWLAWDKQNAVHTMSDVELAWTNQDRPSKRFSHPVATHAYGHPSEKPLPLFQWCLRMFPGDTVLDPYVGSGTTLEAAKLSGRQAIGIEANERYCEIAAKRLSQGVLFGVGASVSPDTGACPRKEQP